MFLTEKSLSDLKQLDQEAKKMVAKVVNTLIDQHGIVLYGSIFENGRYSGFSTEKGENDTHVVMSLAPSIMGLLDPNDDPVHKEALNEEDEKTIQEKRLKALEAELHNARELNKRMAKANPSGGHQV